LLEQLDGVEIFRFPSSSCGERYSGCNGTSSTKWKDTKR